LLILKFDSSLEYQKFYNKNFKTRLFLTPIEKVFQLVCVLLIIEMGECQYRYTLFDYHMQSIVVSRLIIYMTSNTRWFWAHKLCGHDIDHPMSLDRTNLIPKFVANIIYKKKDTLKSVTNKATIQASQFFFEYYSRTKSNNNEFHFMIISHQKLLIKIHYLK